MDAPRFAALSAAVGAVASRRKLLIGIAPFALLAAGGTTFAGAAARNNGGKSSLNECLRRCDSHPSNTCRRRCRNRGT
jgi:hypothetical protein